MPILRIWVAGRLEEQVFPTLREAYGTLMHHCQHRQEYRICCMVLRYKGKNLFVIPQEV